MGWGRTGGRRGRAREPAPCGAAGPGRLGAAPGGAGRGRRRTGGSAVAAGPFPPRPPPEGAARASRASCPRPRGSAPVSAPARSSAGQTRPAGVGAPAALGAGPPVALAARSRRASRLRRPRPFAQPGFPGAGPRGRGGGWACGGRRGRPGLPGRGRGEGGGRPPSRGSWAQARRGGGGCVAGPRSPPVRSLPGPRRHLLGSLRAPRPRAAARPFSAQGLGLRQGLRLEITVPRPKHFTFYSSDY